MATVALGLTATSTTRASDRYDRAIALERHGRLVAALATLRGASLDTYRRRHLDRLREALGVLGAASVYTAQADYRQAQTLLEGLISKLDPVRDVFIERRAYQDLVRLQKTERSETDAAAGALIHRARALEGVGDFRAAARTFRAVADQTATTASPSLLQAARLDALDAEAEAMTAGGGFWNGVGHSLSGVVRGIVKWLLIAAVITCAIAAVTGVIWAYRRRFPLRGKTAIAITDLSVEPRDRNVKSHVLTRELVDEVHSIAGGSDGDGVSEIDERPDLDGTALPLISIADGVELVDSLIYDDTPVRVGPLAVSPRQFVYFVRWCLRRRCDYEITGTLRTDGTQTALTIERLATADRARPLNRWHVLYRGPESRAQAIHDVATRIAVDLEGSYVSRNWRSVREYLDALARLRETTESPDRPAALQAARAALQRSLEHDPHNLLARFNLGLVLRKLGRNEEAVANFKRLERMVADPRGLSSTARAFLERHPEFIYVVMYNRAVALSKGWSAHHEARRTLALLIGHLSLEAEAPALDAKEAQQLADELRESKWPITAPSEPDRQRLECLCRAAWAAALVFRVERTEEQGDDGSERVHSQQESILLKIEQVKTWMEKQSGGDNGGIRFALALNQAQATVDNAYGRVLCFLGNFQDARTAVQSALVALPDLGDAYVNMASILMEKATRHPGWESEAEYHLKRALEVSPRDEKALMLLGTLYRKDSMKRYDDAAECFRKLPGNALACFQLGELLEQKGENEAALEQFDLSLAQRPADNYRAIRFVECILRLDEQGAEVVTKKRLDEARQVARRVGTRGKPPREQVRAALVAEQVERAIAKRAGSAAPRAAVSSSASEP